MQHARHPPQSPLEAAHACGHPFISSASFSQPASHWPLHGTVDAVLAVFVQSCNLVLFEHLHQELAALGHGNANPFVSFTPGQHMLPEHAWPETGQGTSSPWTQEKSLQKFTTSWTSEAGVVPTCEIITPKNSSKLIPWSALPSIPAIIIMSSVSVGCIPWARMKLPISVVLIMPSLSPSEANTFALISRICGHAASTSHGDIRQASLIHASLGTTSSQDLPPQEQRLLPPMESATK